MLNAREETPEGMTIAQPPLRLVRGDGPPLTSRLELDRWLSREMHSSFVAMRGADGRVPSDGIFDIRRNHRRPWKTLAKRLYEAVEAGVAPDQVAAVHFLLQRYAIAARVICERERAAERSRLERLAPYIRRAAVIICTLLLAGAGACGSTTITSPFRPPSAALDSAGTTPVGPAVRP